jgi:AAA ATPase-like protein
MSRRDHVDFALAGIWFSVARSGGTCDPPAGERSARRSPRTSRPIRAAIDSSIAGRGQLVLVQGPAARTRLHDAIEHAARGPARVARVRCTPGDLPLGPWMRIVSSLANTCPPESFPERSRFARFAEILDVLGAATSDVPAVVILEDLHHADRSTLLLLEMLARIVPHRPLAVIAAYRDVSGSPGHPLTESLAELTREPATIHVALRTVSPSMARTSAAAGDSVFRRTGTDWTIVFQGECVRLRDSQGLRYLAMLLRHPWERIQVQALHATAGPPAAGSTRPRMPVSPERARLAVTKAIKAALAKLAVAHPSLARHLGATVRRGIFCSYTPDPRRPVAWEE